MVTLGCQGRCHPLKGAGHDNFKMLRQVPSLRGAGHDDFTMPGQVLLELGAEDAPLCV